MPLYTAKCSRCQLVIRSRSRDKQMSKLSKHIWKNHRTAQIRQMKAGMKASEITNPLLSEYIEALTSSPSTAVRLYKKYSVRQRNHIDSVLRQLKGIVPAEVTLAWELVKAVLDPTFIGTGD